MTMTETRDITRDTARDTALSPEAARARVREAFRESGGTLTGAQAAELVDRSPRWGRTEVAACRAAAAGGSGTPPPADGSRGTGGGSEGGSDDGRPAAAPRVNGTARGTSPAAAARGTTRPRRPAAAPRERQPAARRNGTPLPLLAVELAAVVVVTAVCAVVSYSHIRDLAQLAGAGDLAGWLPLGIDGLVVACSGSLIADRRQGRRGHPSAWAGLILGLAATLAANVIAVDPTLVPIRVVQWVLAGYAPVALAVSGHLLLRMLDSEER